MQFLALLLSVPSVGICDTVDDYQPEKIEHLKMIQNIIDRMARESAAFKRYTILIVAAATALAFRTGADPVVILVAAFPSLICWYLDANYLAQEKWFIAMFNKVRAISPSDRTDFDLTPDKSSSHWRGHLWKISTMGFYLPLFLFLIGSWSILMNVEKSCK
jgi:hypothetical protein